MKKLLLATLILLSGMAAKAQFPGAAAVGKGQQGAMNIGHVYGKLVDSTGKAVTDASVVLLQNKYDR